MQGDFLLMEADKHIGTFKIDSKNNQWDYIAGDSLAEQPLVFRLQIGEQSGNVLSGDVVRDWIINRAPEPNYEFIDALMERVGITEYDPLAFVAYNGGRFNTDEFYLVGQGMETQALS